MGFNFLSGNNMCGVSMSTTNGVTKVTINGVTRFIKGGNVSIINNQIYVDNKPYNIEGLNQDSNVVEIKIEGNVESVRTSANISVKGNVNQKILADGNVNIQGDVTGNIEADGNVIVTGKQSGKINCDGNIIIGGR